MLVRIILLWLSTFLYTFAQIGGISASKLFTYDVCTVPKDKIEFEPSFSSLFYFHTENKGGVAPARAGVGTDVYKTLNVESAMLFRFTYGVAENFELGMSVPSTVEGINFGAKFRLPYRIRGKTAFGLMAGINLPVGNEVYYLEGSNSNKVYYNVGVALGGIVSHSFTKNFSVDFNYIGQKHFYSGNNKDLNTFDYSLGTDWGYYFANKIQAILGLNYYYIGEKISKKILALNPGVTIERGKMFILVLSFPFTVYTKNIDRYVGFSFALTTLLR